MAEWAARPPGIRGFPAQHIQAENPMEHTPVTFLPGTGSRWRFSPVTGLMALPGRTARRGIMPAGRQLAVGRIYGEGLCSVQGRSGSIGTGGANGDTRHARPYRHGPPGGAVPDCYSLARCGDLMAHGAGFPHGGNQDGQAPVEQGTRAAAEGRRDQLRASSRSMSTMVKERDMRRAPGRRITVVNPWGGGGVEDGPPDLVRRGGPLTGKSSGLSTSNRGVGKTAVKNGRRGHRPNFRLGRGRGGGQAHRWRLVGSGASSR